MAENPGALLKRDTEVIEDLVELALGLGKRDLAVDDLLAKLGEALILHRPPTRPAAR